MLAPTLITAYAISLQGDPALDQRVTFTCSAATAEQAIGQISRRTGVPLEPQNPISHEMVILRFREVPLRVAMEKIASATSAEWSRTESGYVLTRPLSMIHEIETKAFQVRLARIKKGIAGRIKELKPFDPKAITAYFEAMKAMRYNGRNREVALLADRAALKIQQPDERFLTWVLAAFDPGTLANLPLDQRTVFSTRPTPMQLALGDGVSAAIQRYVREKDLWAKMSAENRAAQGVPVKPAGLGTSDGAGGGDSADWIYQAIEDGPSWPGGEERITRPVARVLAVMTRESDMIQISFKICDSAGKVMANPSGYLNLVDEGAPVEAGEVTDEPAKPAAGAEPGSRIAFSPLAAELQNLLKTDFANGSAQRFSEDSWDVAPAYRGYDPQKRKPKPSAELVLFLLHPEQCEPLTLFPSEPVLKSAEAKDLNVAACIDDTDLEATINVSGTPSGVIASLQSNLGSVTREKGWFVAVPSDPLHTRHEHRRGLGEYMRGCAKAGRITLDQLGGYAQYTPEYDSSLGCELVGAIVPSDQEEGGYGDSSQSGDWPFVRLYGSLTIDQRALLLGGGKLRFSSLLPGQQATVREIVYRQEAEMEQSRDLQELDPSSMTPDQVRQQVMEMMVGYDTLVTEPTELLPNGVDGSITLSMTSQDDSVLFANMRYREIEMPPRPMDTGTIAMILYGAQNKGITADAGPYGGEIMGYHTGRRQTLTVTLGLPAKCIDSAALVDSSMDQAPSLSLDQLPDETRKQIQDEMDRLRTFYKEMGSQNQVVRRRPGDTGIPPP